MDKYISIIIICFLLIAAIILLIKIFKNIKISKRNFFNNNKNISFIVLFIIAISFFVISFNNFILYYKIEKFGNEIHSIVSSYKGVKGEYPTNSEQLTNYDYYKKIKMWKMGSLKYKFGFKGTFNKEADKLNFIFYSYGLDNDDDSLKVSYPLNYMYIFWPFLNGDIIVKESWVKQLDS